MRKAISVLMLLSMMLAAFGPVNIVRADTYDGSGGDDTITGGGGDDTLNGYEGDDTLDGAAGDDILNGGPGDDTLTGGPGEDEINGDEGTDTLVETLVEGSTTTYPIETAPEDNPMPPAESCIVGNCVTPSLGATKVITTVTPGTSSEIEYSLTTTTTTESDMTLTDTSLTTTSNGPESTETVTTTETPYSSTVETWTYTFVNPNPPPGWYQSGCNNHPRVCEWKLTSTGPGDSGTAVTQTGNSTSSSTFSSDEVDTLSSIEEASLTGNSNDNRLDAFAFTLGSVTLYGLGGDDTLIGGWQDDHLYGGEGDDILDGGLSGYDTVYQTGTNIFITTNANGNGSMVTSGGSEPGSDTLLSIEAANLTGLINQNNTLNASGFSGNATLQGGDGNDTLLGGTGNDVLFGYAGDDYLDGGDGADYLDGGAGNDRMFGGKGSDNMVGGEGNDAMFGGEGNDFIVGGLGDDFMTGDAGNDFLFGGEGNDVMEGGKGDDFLAGGAGNDIMDGNDGDDVMEGDIGNDIMSGGAGNDLMNGGDGDDLMFGGNGMDTMLGGSGNDTLFGGNGDDVMFGEAGDDTLTGGAGNDLMLGGSGDDVLLGGAGDDIMYGGIGDDFMVGGLGDDFMTGDAGNDVLFGGLGNDTIFTSENQDYIDAGAGNDTIIISGSNGNGEGNETYATGGTGANYFLFMAGAYGDLVLESQGEDTLDFSAFNSAVSIDMSSTDRQEVGSWTDSIGTWSLFITLKGLFTNLIGSNYDDTLIGNSLDNNIEGRGGDDLLSGGAGIDNIYGGDRTSALNSFDLTDGFDTDLDALAFPGGVTYEDNWYSIEAPVALPPVVGGGGGGVLPLAPLGLGGLGLLIPVTGADPVMLDCGGVPDRVFTLQLPNNDTATITGMCQNAADSTFWAIMTSEELETLPAEITEGAFTGGMTLNILEQAAGSEVMEPLTVLPDGTQVEYSFVLPPNAGGINPNQLYWDATTPPGSWLDLPEYVDGGDVPSELHPGSGDGMIVLSGWQLVGNRLNVTTNFTGTIVKVGQ
jgi:Ca2+-binding RTX toxin-like protein